METATAGVCFPAGAAGALSSGERRVRIMGDFNNDGFEDISCVIWRLRCCSRRPFGVCRTATGVVSGGDEAPARIVECPDFARRGEDQALDFNA